MAPTLSVLCVIAPSDCWATSVINQSKPLSKFNCCAAYGLSAQQLNFEPKHRVPCANVEKNKKQTKRKKIWDLVTRTGGWNGLMCVYVSLLDVGGRRYFTCRTEGHSSPSFLRVLFLHILYHIRRSSAPLLLLSAFLKKNSVELALVLGLRTPLTFVSLRLLREIKHICTLRVFGYLLEKIPILSLPVSFHQSLYAGSKTSQPIILTSDLS
jgi:hypothetical protein